MAKFLGLPSLHIYAPVLSNAVAKVSCPKSVGCSDMMIRFQMKWSTQ